MIQRKQTLFLIIALAAMCICACLPIGIIVPLGMGTNAEVYNLGIKGVSGFSMPIWPLFVLLLTPLLLTVAAIFSYKKRKMQAWFCTLSELFCAAWYVYFGICVFWQLRLLGEFQVQLATFMPLFAIIFYALAHKGIMDDERLIRSIDRIR